MGKLDIASPPRASPQLMARRLLRSAGRGTLAQRVCSFWTLMMTSDLLGAIAFWFRCGNRPTIMELSAVLYAIFIGNSLVIHRYLLW
jgi:hypothetical protein